jgi:hypothetical protein
VRFLAAVSLIATVLGACAPTLPDTPIERALIRDVARVVDVRQKVGWVIDEKEVDAALPDVLPSACRAGAPVRAAGLRWLDGEIARRGGEPAEAWRRAGKQLDKIDELLLFARTRLVLARADEWVRDGKCPFWMEPEAGFDGTQVIARRWTVGAEAGGRFVVGSESGVFGYGGGGGGRVLGGYGVTERLSLFVGLEGGGSARFTNAPIGERFDLPDLLGVFAVPVVARRTMGLSGFVEAEVGPMAFLNQVEGRLEPGVRAGFGIGGHYLRLKRGLLPRFTFAVSFDHAPGWGDGATITQASAGLRAGFDFSR